MAPLVGDVGGELLPPGSPGFTARTCTARSTAEATSALVSGSIRTAASGTLPAGPVVVDAHRVPRLRGHAR